MATPSPNLSVDAVELSQLAGGLAHELKNPLSTLQLRLSLLREELNQLEGDVGRRRRIERDVDTLQNEVGRLSEILDDFLRYARTDNLELSAVSLNEVVQEVVRFVEPETTARGIGIRTFLAADLPEAKLDVERFRQVVLNLLVNARQALSEQGGEITVFTRFEEHRLLLEVVDNGPGMGEEILERCFNAYYSTKRGGSGLGLPTVRRLVRAHGGSVEVESQAGRGTRFTIALPSGTEPLPESS